MSPHPHAPTAALGVHAQLDVQGAALPQRRKNLVELQQKKQRVLKAQIRRAQARITNAERKRRTHRLVLIGTYIEHTTKDDQPKRDRLMKGLDAFLERDHDRAVFDFKPRPKPPASDASGQS